MKGKAEQLLLNGHLVLGLNSINLFNGKGIIQLMWFKG